MDMAEQIMQKSAKRNDELWKAYPELHKMSMQLEKGSAACGEILYRYGSWANARKEAARHGVSLTYTKDGQASRWDGDFAELQKLGAGLLPAETPSSAADALEAMMSAHDAIRPTLENAYDEDWDGAKQDIAMQIWQRYMNTPEMAIGENAQLREQFARIDAIAQENTQRVLEAFQDHRVADAYFAGTTGYGYDDLGRDKLDEIYAQIFGTEAALVRIQFVNGTHAIASALYGCLKAGDVLVSAVGRPYRHHAGGHRSGG